MGVGGIPLGGTGELRTENIYVYTYVYVHRICRRHILGTCQFQVFQAWSGHAQHERPDHAEATSPCCSLPVARVPPSTVGALLITYVLLPYSKNIATVSYTSNILQSDIDKFL